MMITRKLQIFLGLVIVLVLMGGVTLIYQGTRQKQEVAGSQVAFLLAPETANKSVGEVFDVKLSLDSKSYDVSGIDINLTFDNGLELLSFNSDTAFNGVLVNKPDNINGTFRLLATKSVSNNATGVIDVGTLTFKGKTAGTSTVNFQNPLVTAYSETQYIPTAANSTGQYNIKGGS